jgi:RHS repeat-associated protein
MPTLTVLTGYIYDAGGTRVAKGTITAWSCNPALNGFKTVNDYVLGLGGEQVTEMGVDTTAGSSTTTLAWQHTNVFAGGKLLGTYDKDGLHFYFDDPLGTRRAQTDYAGHLEQTCQSLPFGDQLACTGGDLQAPTEHHFTGKERDTESGNDYFKYRYLASSMGRWLSPDPSGLTHADLGNPQELNLYSYVGNRPLTFADLQGLCWKGFQWACNIIQRVENVASGYGFQTDNQVALHPNKRSQRKIEQNRRNSYWRETHPGQKKPVPYVPFDLTIDPNAPTGDQIGPTPAPKPRVTPGPLECLLAPDASIEIANVANQSNSSSGDDDTGGGGGTGGAYLNMRNNGLKPTSDMIGPMGSAEGAGAMNGAALALDAVVSYGKCRTY